MKTRIELLRDIVAGHQAQRIRIDGRKVYVDAFTASAVIAVHDVLTADNRAKLLALPWPTMVSVVWKLCK